MLNAQTVVVVVMATTSAVMWWLWLRRWKATGAIGPQVESSPVAINPVAAGLTLAMIAYSLVSVLLPAQADVKVIPSIENVWRACLVNGLLVLVLLLTLIGNDVRRFAAFGFSLNNCRRQLGDGIETALASFLPVLAVLRVTSPFRSPEEQHPYLRLLEQDASLPVLGAVLLAAVVLAPLLEELMFRVIVLGWLKPYATSTEAIAISSVLFAAVHGPLNGLALLPLAVLLGSLYDRKRSFWSVFVAHAFFNYWNILL